MNHWIRPVRPVSAILFRGGDKSGFHCRHRYRRIEAAAAIARRANEAITEAMNLLNRIVVHNDWECAERDAINDNTIRNKNDARYIQQCAEQFYRNVEMSADLFRQAEQELRQSFETVEGPLGTFLSLVPQNEAQPGAAQIAMCSFENISSAIKGAVK